MTSTLCKDVDSERRRDEGTRQAKVSKEVRGGRASWGGGRGGGQTRSGVSRGREAYGRSRVQPH